MAGPNSRPRSNTSGSASSQRPKSRASTATIRSLNTQPLQQYRHEPESSRTALARYINAQSTSYTPEEMITRSEQQLTNPHQEYAIDPSLQDPVNHGRAPTIDHCLNENQSTVRSSASRQRSFEGKEAPGLESVNEEQPQDDARDDKKKKGSASSIANDMELRRLFRENQGRSLKDVAAQVLANERGPKSEKTKQIFALLWLHASCRKSSSSLPRNRVFVHYATRCGTERVPPLNPASFGKLVRIIFPGITTRRLGMRGESKYHYVDLSLVEDAYTTVDTSRAESATDVSTGVGNTGGKRQKPQIPADTAVFPSPNIPFFPDTFTSNHNKSMATGCLYLDPAGRKYQKGSSASNMVRRDLKFSTGPEHSYYEEDPFECPRIDQFLPVGTDSDAANALTAVYRSHCISIIDCFRFCKEKVLWHHFTSFHGTLTVPVQKLLAHPNIAPWIEECDWIMYQKMIRFVAPLALQVMPIRVIDTFRAISVKLGPHISLTFQNHSQLVRDAKLGPATIFASLLDRLLRVNATAHAAANMLTNDANREQMWRDWVTYVKPVKVVESCLPTFGYTRVMQILTADIRDLLSPLRNIPHLEMQHMPTDAGENIANNLTQHAHPDLDDSSTEGVLDRWTSFLHSLPTRFPGADARLLLHCVNDVGSAALRDITMGQASSFGSWWVTKVWVDEMFQWLAEKGGFMDHSPKSMEMRGRSNFSPDVEFPMDEASEVLEGSRPRTAASESMEVPSRLHSVDISRQDFCGHGRPPSVLAQEKVPTPQTRDASEKPTAIPHATRSISYTEIPLSHNVHGESAYGLGISHSQIQNAEFSHTNKACPVTQGHARSPRVEIEHDHNHDDSGIGMGLEDEELCLSKYDRFIAGDVNGGSDPADVVVC